MYGLLLESNDPMPITVGSLELDNDEWVYTAYDEAGDGVIVGVGSVIGAIFGAEKKDEENA
ncbi:hypothetical protein [Nonomuraea recticatena]|uniref:hypothetical protein n=1 Tax=Nonomuraea recticatena TaxID=46178 RepID=UPI00360EA50E